MTDKNPEVDLSAYEEKYLLYRQARQHLERYEKLVKEYKAEFQRLMGDATTAIIHGQQVFTYDHTDTFRRTQFVEEHPVLAKEYTRPVYKEELDLEALRRDHPAVYEQYRSRQFVTKKVV